MSTGNREFEANGLVGGNFATRQHHHMRCYYNRNKVLQARHDFSRVSAIANSTTPDAYFAATLAPPAI